MKKQQLHILVSIIVAIVVVSLAIETYASGSRMISRRKPFRKSRKSSFTVSGTYTGTLSGQITLNGKKLRITDATTIYVIGRGFKEQERYVVKANVLVSGVRKKGIPIVHMVLVRPDESSRSTYTIAPRIDDNTVPSGANPNVGVRAEDAPM